MLKIPLIVFPASKTSRQFFFIVKPKCKLNMNVIEQDTKFLILVVFY